MNPFLIALLLSVVPSGPAAPPDVPIWPPISRAETMDPEYGIVRPHIHGRLAGVDLRSGQLLIHTQLRGKHSVRVRAADITLIGDPLSAEQYGRLIDLGRAKAFLAECATTERVAACLDLAEDGHAPRVTLSREPPRVVRPITLDELEAILERAK